MPADLPFVSQEDVVAAGGLDMDGTIATVEEAEAWRVVRHATESGIGTPLRRWERPVWT